MQFTQYEANSLKQPATVQMIGRYKIEFHAFCAPGNENNHPVVFLGGAFQSFASFKSEVELVYQTHPVILLDLPSQGSNDQLVPEFELDSFAHLIKDFFDVQEINQVIMVGISYGSAMATIFAAEYPQYMYRLLVSGITCFRRDSLVLLLEDSLRLLSQGEMQAFAATAVSNLINHNRMNETEIGQTYRRLLFRQVARLNENEQHRYAQNTERLLRFGGFKKYPTCPTLVATGEFDNFTLPEENAAFAEQCPDAQFAVIRDADHLSQFERREVTSELFYRFMKMESIDNIEGAELVSRDDLASTEKRLQPRLKPINSQSVLVDTTTNIEHEIEVKNINFSGCQIELNMSDLTISETSTGLFLKLPDMETPYHVRVLEKDHKVLRCVIIQRNIKEADALMAYLDQPEAFFDPTQIGFNQAALLA